MVVPYDPYHLCIVDDRKAVYRLQLICFGCIIQDENFVGPQPKLMHHLREVLCITVRRPHDLVTQKYVLEDCTILIEVFRNRMSILLTSCYPYSKIIRSFHVMQELLASRTDLHLEIQAMNCNHEIIFLDIFFTRKDESLVKVQDQAALPFFCIEARLLLFEAHQMFLLIIWQEQGDLVVTIYVLKDRALLQHASCRAPGHETSLAWTGMVCNCEIKSRHNVKDKGSGMQFAM